MRSKAEDGKAVHKGGNKRAEGFRSNRALMVSCMAVALSDDCLRRYKAEMITSCLCSLHCNAKLKAVLELSC